MRASLAHILNPVDVSPRQVFRRPIHPEGQELTKGADSLISYKRVPKACTQCRRDKSRCDRARPCYGCIRKGRVDLCIDGCLSCRKSRLSCDASRPCRSCLQDGSVCVEDDPAAMATSRKKQKAVPPVTTSPRPIQPRPRPDIPTLEQGTKLVCVTCQRDGSKCDGSVVCNPCAERGEQCSYVARSSKFVKRRCALCRKKNKKCDNVRPCVHCIKADVPCVDLPRKGLGHGLRVKRACVGCRVDKIQCEEARPCGSCKKKNMECIERGCKACAHKAKRCPSCTRQDQFQPEDSRSYSSASCSEEENDNSPGSLCSSPTCPPSCNLPPLDSRSIRKSNTSYSLPEGSRLENTFVLARCHSLDAPGRHLSLDNFERANYVSTYNPSHLKFPSTPLGYATDTSYCSVDVPPLSLLTYTSHMRTRSFSDVGEE